MEESDQRSRETERGRLWERRRRGTIQGDSRSSCRDGEGSKEGIERVRGEVEEEE